MYNPFLYFFVIYILFVNFINEYFNYLLTFCIAPSLESLHSTTKVDLLPTIPNYSTLF